MASGPTTRRFTVEEYYRMAEAGILGEGDVFRDPIEGGYRTLAVLQPGDGESLATLPALKVQADAVLP